MDGNMVRFRLEGKRSYRGARSRMPKRRDVSPTSTGIYSPAYPSARQDSYATSQLARPTQKNKYGFKFSQKKKSKETEREHQNMSVLALEIFGTQSVVLSIGLANEQPNHAINSYLTQRRMSSQPSFTATRTKTTHYPIQPHFQVIMPVTSSSTPLLSGLVN